MVGMIGKKIMMVNAQKYHVLIKMKKAYVFNMMMLIIFIIYLNARKDTIVDQNQILIILILFKFMKKI